ncbi:type IV pilus modification PilV family protein [Caballeronia grimmiae]|jgi:type IV pilus assembly protein PilV|uniref:type IV pilus modification PilV family protein n=1 Tax=Caballeronia grimmiae TaxID=1071679 RepID=UPI0038BDC7E2
MKTLQSGDSLLEVMIALSITAVTALGFVALQSVLARGERSALIRERAALIADSVVEGIRSDADRASIVSQWQARAAAMLPDADISVQDRADGVRVATVSWRADDRADPCPEPQARPRTSCIVVAFAR